MRNIETINADFRGTASRTRTEGYHALDLEYFQAFGVDKTSLGMAGGCAKAVVTSQSMTPRGRAIGFRQSQSDWYGTRGTNYQRNQNIERTTGVLYDEAIIQELDPADHSGTPRRRPKAQHLETLYSTSEIRTN